MAFVGKVVRGLLGGYSRDATAPLIGVAVVAVVGLFTSERS